MQRLEQLIAKEKCYVYNIRCMVDLELQLIN